MNKQTKIILAVLAIFIVGMTLSVAFAEPASAVKYKGKKSMTVTIKDGKKKVKVKCKYKRSTGDYQGKKGKYIATVGKDQAKAQFIKAGTLLLKTQKHGKCATNLAIKNQ